MRFCKDSQIDTIILLCYRRSES